MTAHRILVVEDNWANAQLIQQLLVSEGHEVVVVGDGQEALDLVRQQHPDLILLDLEVPRVHGYDVCRQLKEDPATRLIPIVVITGHGDHDAKLRAWEAGADDFMTKPFRCLEVIVRCRALLRTKRFVDERDSSEQVVFAFARVVEAKSLYTHGHSERVAAYALALAAQVGSPEEEWETLRRGALLHDIGKVSIPDAILNKPDSLTPAEFEIMKRHTIHGVRIVEPLASVRDTLPLIRSHHERLDGRGYPDGLHGDEIPLIVRLLTVVDVYDSLASARPYRDAIPHAQCLEILQREAANGGMDPGLVEQFCRMVASEALLGITSGTAAPSPPPSRPEGLLQPSHSTPGSAAGSPEGAPSSQAAAADPNPVD